LQGRAENYDGLGYSAAVLGALFTAINIVVMRRCKDVHFSILVLHFSVWSLLVASLLANVHGPWTSGGHLHNASLFHWGLAILVGVTGLLGQVLLAHALSMEGAGKVAVTRSLDIVLAFVLQVTRTYILFQRGRVIKINCSRAKIMYFRAGNI